MKVSLRKGEKVNLSKHGNLKRIRVALGWKTNNYSGNLEFDLDASAFLVNENEKVAQDSDFVFYNNLVSGCGNVKHTGDVLTGSGDDDEVIIVDLDKVNQRTKAIIFTVTIHDAIIRKQYYGQVSNAYVRIINDETDEEILRYNLAEDFSKEQTVIFSKLARIDLDGWQDEWQFEALGKPFNGGLFELCQLYGVNV